MEIEFKEQLHEFVKAMITIDKLDELLDRVYHTDDRAAAIKALKLFGTRGVWAYKTLEGSFDFLDKYLDVVKKPSGSPLGRVQGKDLIKRIHKIRAILDPKFLGKDLMHRMAKIMAFLRQGLKKGSFPIFKVEYEELLSLYHDVEQEAERGYKDEMALASQIKDFTFRQYLGIARSAMSTARKKWKHLAALAIVGFGMTGCPAEGPKLKEAPAATKQAEKLERKVEAKIKKKVEAAKKEVEKAKKAEAPKKAEKTAKKSDWLSKDPAIRYFRGGEYAKLWDVDTDLLHAHRLQSKCRDEVYACQSHREALIECSGFF